MTSSDCYVSISRTRFFLPEFVRKMCQRFMKVPQKLREGAGRCENAI